MKKSINIHRNELKIDLHANVKFDDIFGIKLAIN